MTLYDDDTSRIATARIECAPTPQASHMPAERRDMLLCWLVALLGVVVYVVTVEVWVSFLWRVVLALMVIHILVGGL